MELRPSKGQKKLDQDKMAFHCFCFLTSLEKSKTYLWFMLKWKIIIGQKIVTFSPGFRYQYWNNWMQIMYFNYIFSRKLELTGMPLFCLHRPAEWWGILQVCTRLSHLQPKRSIVRRLHMKFQEVWHFVSQTPANENNQKGCVIMIFYVPPIGAFVDFWFYVKREQTQKKEQMLSLRNS